MPKRRNALVTLRARSRSGEPQGRPVAPPNELTAYLGFCEVGVLSEDAGAGKRFDIDTDLLCQQRFLSDRHSGPALDQRLVCGIAGVG
jgi:hypothetical protein